MVDIASQEENKSVTLKSIAERQNISENYLEQLIAVLKNAGFVKSTRGAFGGYSINCKPGDVSVRSLLELLEGSLYPVECISETERESCGSGSCQNCVTKPIWEKMYKSVNDVLDGITLGDLVNDYILRRQLNDSAVLSSQPPF
jgi:Rrf2 family protein